jgi:hypothetical protein
VIRIGKIVGTFVDTVRHGKKKGRHYQVVYSGGGQDVKTSQAMHLAGIDTQANLETISLELESGTNMRFLIATEDFITKAAAAGEFEIYSASTTAKKARVKAKNNGKVYIASVTNGMDLHTALSTLENGLSSFCTTAGSATNAPQIAAASVTLGIAVTNAITQLNKILDGTE